MSAVAAAVLVIGRPRGVTGVRIRGGPTTASLVLSVRLEIADRLGDVERPRRGDDVEVDVIGAAEPVSTHGVLDDEGAVELVLPSSGRDPAHARIRIGGSFVVDARWSLSVDAWARGARRRGGWVERRFEDGTRIRAAAERGVFAVPFASPLWVEAARGGSFLTALDVHGDGADVVGPLSLSAGRLRYGVTPREHAAVVAVRAPGTTATELDVALAVVPGAFFAELRGNDLVVRSPIARDRAYVAIVDERERVAGATVALEADATGATGVLRNPSLPDGVPLWAVVSSEPELRSASVVGWPIRYAIDSAEPPKTFDVPDALLVDTMPRALSQESDRQRRVRLLAALIAAVSLFATAAAIAARSTAARSRLTTHLASAGADPESTTRVTTTAAATAWAIATAVLTLALAALLFALFATGTP
ncbi:MAG TPA: hypothetical protein VHC69_31345 [Polyangiaceae bacterium]|nr:hypothetical protein [Polyangiaceae bacterium]